jgi:hypothetical protein
VGAAIDLQHHAFGRSSLSTAAMPVRTSLTGGSDPVRTKNAPDLFPTQLDLLLFLELLRQMMIVESAVLSPG